MKLQLLLLLLTTRSPLAAGTPADSCSNPLEWTRDPDSYSVSEYADHLTQCTDKCNDVGHCCTLGAGGCNFASCSTGCHIAWFSENLATCKTECNRANSFSCRYTWHHAEIKGAGFNPSMLDSNDPYGVEKCVDGITCGCPTNNLQKDCSDYACAEGCDQAYKIDIRHLFYHGEDVVVDPLIELSLDALTNALSDIHAHVDSSNTLTDAQLQTRANTFTDNAGFLDKSLTAMNAAFELIDAYEENRGALFINSETVGGITREGDRTLMLERIILLVQQAVFDGVFGGKLVENEVGPEGSVIENCQHYLNGRAWKTSSFFPGHVDPPSNPTVAHSVVIDGSKATYWGEFVCFADQPALRPTGLYLSPGGVAKITVPSAFVNKGFQIRVGASEADNTMKDTHLRMDRVSALFEIDSTTVYVANPLGGGIYIRVPYEASAGEQTISISGSVVKAPFFSMTSTKTTTKVEWDNELRYSPAPWADFVTDKFFMQVPTSWLASRDFDYFEDLLIKRDQAMTGASEFVGIPISKRNDYLAYVQPDLHIRANFFGVGYPQINNLVSSSANGIDANPDHWMVSSPYNENSVFWHELGHCLFGLNHYRGEAEAIVNALYAYIRQAYVGLDFDTAFAGSFDDNNQYTPDQAMMHWMVTENFRDGKEMNYSETEYDEMRYQNRGYAKYADIARLFDGWQTIANFYLQDQLDFMDGLIDSHPDNAPGSPDYRTLRLSKSVGVDLTPLIHFWGIHPVNPDKLRKSMAANNLSLSDSVKDFLDRYITLIPKNNSDFRTYAYAVYPDLDKGGCQSPLYGCGWFDVWKDRYNAADGTKAVQAAQSIIDLYYSSTPAPIGSSTTSPTTATTGSTTTRPTSAPAIGSCSDSPLGMLVNKIKRDCKWVQRIQTSKRCKKTGVASHCAVACGVSDCMVDSTIRIVLTNNTLKSCNWVKKKNTIKRCKIVGVSETCRKTCSNARSMNIVFNE